MATAKKPAIKAPAVKKSKVKEPSRTKPKVRAARPAGTQARGRK